MLDAKAGSAPRSAVTSASRRRVVSSRNWFIDGERSSRKSASAVCATSG